MYMYCSKAHHIQAQCIWLVVLECSLHIHQVSRPYPKLCSSFYIFHGVYKHSTKVTFLHQCSSRLPNTTVSSASLEVRHWFAGTWSSMYRLAAYWCSHVLGVRIIVLTSVHNFAQSSPTQAHTHAPAQHTSKQSQSLAGMQSVLLPSHERNRSCVWLVEIEEIKALKKNRWLQKREQSKQHTDPLHDVGSRDVRVRSIKIFTWTMPWSDPA